MSLRPPRLTSNLPADAGPLSIVVLPFTNQTGDPQKAYIADGLTSSITADLSRIRDAFIVPVSSALAYRDKAAPVKQIGQDLGVRFVLQGSVWPMATSCASTRSWPTTFRRAEVDGDLRRRSRGPVRAAGSGDRAHRQQHRKPDGDSGGARKSNPQEWRQGGGLDTARGRAGLEVHSRCRTGRTSKRCCVRPWLPIRATRMQR